MNQILKCPKCGARMIDMTNDHILECLNCGIPYQEHDGIISTGAFKRRLKKHGI